MGEIILSQKVEENVTQVYGSVWTLNDGDLQRSTKLSEDVCRY